MRDACHTGRGTDLDELEHERLIATRYDALRRAILLANE